MIPAVVLCCLLSTLGGAVAGRADGSVVQKVIEMLQENKVKIMADLKAEETEMAAYSQFCDDDITAKGYAIKTAARAIVDLDATVADAKAQSNAAEDEIATLGNVMAEKDRELSEAAAARKAERANFVTTEKALVASVDQLEKATVLMKRHAAALLQSGAHSPNSGRDAARALSKLLGKVIEAAWVDHGSARALKGFLQAQEGSSEEADSDMRLLKGETAPSSGGIVEVLEDMKEKASETLSSTRTADMRANHNNQMMVQSLTDMLENAKQKISAAKGLKASLAQASGQADGEQSRVQKAKIADTVYLSTLKKECADAAQSWAARQQSANDEMAAIEKAKSILSDGATFVQTSKDEPMGAEADDDKTAAKRSQLVSKLQVMGHQLSSYAMMELASSAAADPFEKIRGLIGDMVSKLQEEANAEASQKAFCDDESKKSRAQQQEKSMRSDDLRSRLDSASAAQAALQEKIKELQGELAQIDASFAEATQIRNQEHTTYLKSSADFKGAAAAVEGAIHVLKEYYAGAGSALVQTAASAPSFGGNKGDAASGIIGILETSGEEFSKMYMEVETVEAEAASSFKKMGEERKVQKATKEADVKGAESEIKSLAVAIQNGGEDLGMATKELDAVMSYIEKLRPQCQVKAQTYEEKKAHRDAEIEGLKEALQLLDAPALIQLRGAHRH